MTMMYQFVLFSLLLCFATLMAHRNACRPLSNPRCLNARVLSLKEQQTSLLEQVSGLKEQVSGLVEKVFEMGPDASCSQDFRNWYCDQDVTQWATTVNAYSSQLSPYFGAQRILGLPFWYPNNGGDSYAGWVPDFGLTDEMHWIELEYDESIYASKVDVYQTNNAGIISKVLSRNDPTEDWVEIYVADETVAGEDPEILSVTPEGEAQLMKYIRLEIDQTAASEESSILIDAVSMTGKRNCPVCTEP